MAEFVEAFVEELYLVRVGGKWGYTSICIVLDELFGVCVERVDVDAVDVLLLEAVVHFITCFSGEGDGEDVVGVDSGVFGEVFYAFDEHRGFPGSGCGDAKYGLVWVDDSSLLGVVVAVEEEVELVYQCLFFLCFRAVGVRYVWYRYRLRWILEFFFSSVCQRQDVDVRFVWDLLVFDEVMVAALFYEPVDLVIGIREGSVGIVFL